MLSDKKGTNMCISAIFDIWRFFSVNLMLTFRIKSFFNVYLAHLWKKKLWTFKTFHCVNTEHFNINNLGREHTTKQQRKG